MRAVLLAGLTAIALAGCGGTADDPVASAVAATEGAVYDGATVYVRLPEDDPRRPWLRIRDPGAGLPEIVPSDPARGLQFLRAHGGRVERLGDERVRGVAATRYRVSVDLEAVAERASPAMRRRMLRAFAAGESRTLPLEVWIDADGFIRRQRSARTLPRDEDRTTLISTVEYFDFGVDVDVRIPPARLVRRG